MRLVTLAFSGVLLACSADPSPTARAPAPTVPVSDAAPTFPPLPEVESGFIEVPPQLRAQRTNGRIFYSFQRADNDAENRPLIVMFNGGPNGSTTAGLLVGGTSRFFVSPDDPVATPQPNPHSWTRFANVLFVDQRHTGFSYDFVDAEASFPNDCVFNPHDDAADYLRVVLRFLAAHPALQKAEVAFAGQSYGGACAQFMFDALFDRGATSTANAALDEEVRAHFRITMPDTNGEPTPAQAARQFGTQILLQPLVLGDDQIYKADDFPPPQALPENSGFHTMKAEAWELERERRYVTTFANRESARTVLGIEWKAIPRLAAAERGRAFRQGKPDHPDLDRLVNDEMAAELGATHAPDSYYRYFFGCESDGDVYPATTFEKNLRWVRTFITNATYDGVVRSELIPHLLARRFPIERESKPRSNEARPGWFRVTLPESADGPEATVEIRFPTYAESGHAIATTEPAALAEDVMQFLGK